MKTYRVMKTYRMATITRILHYSPEEFGWYYEVKFGKGDKGQVFIIKERNITREKPEAEAEAGGTDKPAAEPPGIP